MAKLEDKKVEYLVGFDKVADNMKVKVKKLAEKKGISSFTMLGIPTSGEPKYSGGMVGDAKVLVQGLYYMAKQREDVRAVLEIVVNALKANDLQEFSDLEDLKEKGVLTAMCVNALNDHEITDLKDLKQKTKQEVRAYKNIGKKAFEKLEELMNERSWDFLTEKKE